MPNDGPSDLTAKTEIMTAKYQAAMAQIRAEAESKNASERGKGNSDDFKEWLRATTPGYNWDWPYLVKIREALNGVTNGTIKRLMLLVPPRHGKSSIATIRYPVYRMEKDATIRVCIGCYSQEFAKKFGRMARGIARRRKIALSEEKSAAKEWETAAGGVYRSCGVGSPPTGEGFDLLICLAGDTLITTDRGRIPIERIVNDHLTVKILTHDIKTGKRHWRPIEAYEKTRGRPCAKIRFSNSASVVSTIDHPFFIKAIGYVRADSLNPGDEVMTDAEAVRSMRDNDNATASALRESQTRNLLQPFVPREGADRKRECLLQGQDQKKMSGMQEDIRSSSEHAGSVQMLLNEMRGPHAQRPQQLSMDFEDDSVRQLQSSHSEFAAITAAKTFLLTQVREPGASDFNQRQEQRSICSRSRRQGIPGRVPESNQKSSSTRQGSMSAVRSDEESKIQTNGHSSHRPRQAEQQADESDFVVQAMSHSHPQDESQTKVLDATFVESVEPVETPQFVFNVRVEGEHNYFANGILTHNCDDPIKQKEEADSIIKRDRVWDWWTIDLMTRLEPNAAIIVISTPWHVDDMMHRILKSEDAQIDPWTVLRFPAEAEENDPLGRKVGEPLCPERYDKKALASRKRVLGARQYSALFGMKPKADEGSLFQRKWIEPNRCILEHDQIIFPDGLHAIIDEHPDILIVDPAMGGRHSDDTGVGGYLFVGERIVVLKSIGRRIPIETLPDEIDWWARTWYPRYAGVEANGFQRQVVKDIREKVRLPVRELDPAGESKKSRAFAATVMAEEGRIYWLDPDDDEDDWYEKWMTELENFTGEGDEKDAQVDCLAYAVLEYEQMIGLLDDPGPTTFGGMNREVNGQIVQSASRALPAASQQFGLQRWMPGMRGGSVG